MGRIEGQGRGMKWGRSIRCRREGPKVNLLLLHRGGLALGHPSLSGCEGKPSSSSEKGLPRWLSVKEFTCQAGDAGSIPGSGKPHGGGNGRL